MSVEILMPQIASDMTEADVVSWLVAPGELVQKGDVLLEIETEKSTVEIESPASGTLREIQVPAGSTNVAVGTLLGIVDAASDAATPDGPARANRPVAEQSDTPVAIEPEHGDSPRAAAPSSNREPHPDARSREDGLPATALARRIAEQAGVDLGSVRGTGPHGRITRSDVEVRLTGRAPYETTAPARARIAGGAAALLELTANCRVDALVDAVERLNALAAGAGIGLVHGVVRAAAMALGELPEATDGSDRAALAEGVDIAIAVTSEAGFALPVIRAADRKGLGELSAEIQTLAEEARTGARSKADGTGAEVAVIDLGVAGIDGVRLASNPPGSRVLGVGAARAEPVVDDGRVVPGTTLLLTLSTDRGAIHETAAARLLALIRQHIEHPASMLL